VLELTSWNGVLSEKLTGPQLVKKCPAFYWAPVFFTKFTIARHLSLAWAKLIHSVPHPPISFRSISILSPSTLIYSKLSPKQNLNVPFLFPVHATSPDHLTLLDFITWIIFANEYSLWSSSICSLFHSFVTSSLLLRNVYLSTLFSNILSLSPCLNIRDQASHP
jgi:hypothetical protein